MGSEQLNKISDENSSFIWVIMYKTIKEPGNTVLNGAYVSQVIFLVYPYLEKPGLTENDSVFKRGGAQFFLCPQRVLFSALPQSYAETKSYSTVDRVSFQYRECVIKDVNLVRPTGSSA